MKQIMVVLGIALSIAAGRLWAEAAEGSCVECHRGLKENPALTHNFTDWQSSIHAKSGVECQACHGGDAAQAVKAAAHAGLLPSTKAKSPIYYTQIPATCGKCHGPEFAAFRKSAHYKQLQSSGNGPNCVTCHGAMANHVIDSRSMQLTCSLCHHQPIQAYQARAALEEAQDSLRRLNGEIQSALSTGLTDPSSQKKTYQLLADRLHQAKVDWHAFQTDSVLASAKDISQSAEATFTELKSKNKNP
jgi:hypothetical protein